MAFTIQLGMSMVGDNNAFSRKVDNQSITTTGSHIDHRIMNIGTTEETIDINADILAGSDPGLCLIFNKDATNYVQIGPATTVYQMQVPASRFCILWLNAAATQIFMKANTAACDVEFWIIER